jgi:predicted lysophospholipase L1 biosynthesis ABC-type transport system permease subunit
MKKSKIFMATGALILAATAIFATKTNKKFKTIATGFTGSSTALYEVKGVPSAFPMTNTQLSNPVHLQINNTIEVGTLYTQSTLTGNEVFYQ